MNSRRGFTLIELLVVIAIIGLLSSIVLASLNTARAKANRAAAESAMHQAWTDMYACALGGAPPSCYAADSKCLGGAGAVPIEGRVLCSGSNAKWPVVSKNGYSYSAYTYGYADTGPTTFNFEIHDATGDAICCTQNGCQHIVDASNGLVCQGRAY